MRFLLTKNGRLVLAIPLVLATAYLTAVFGWRRPPEDLGYRLIAEVEMDGQLHSGSGVVRIYRTWWHNWRLEWEQSTKVVGEAVYVDLGRWPYGPKRQLVVTLAGKSPQGQGFPERWPYWGQNTSKPSRLGPAHYFDKAGDTEDVPRPVNTTDAKEIVSRTALDPSHFPALIDFSDAERHDPGVTLDSRDVGHRLGGNIKLKTIYVDPTDDPATRDLVRDLPWIRTLTLSEFQHLTHPPGIADVRKALIRNDLSE